MNVLQFVLFMIYNGFGAALLFYLVKFLYELGCEEDAA